MTPPPEPHPRVLVVSGSATLAHDLRRLLEPTGIDVRRSGGEVGHESADVVVVDLDRIGPMPAELSPLPVLAVVRRDAPDDVAAAVGAGASDVLPHPFVAAEVMARVAAAARLSAAVSALRSRNDDLVAWATRAGHDLRTPLAVIAGMAETLEAAWERLPEADRARMLGAIRNQAAKAMAMLDEAFALARGEQAGAGEEGPAAGA